MEIVKIIFCIWSIVISTVLVAALTYDTFFRR